MSLTDAGRAFLERCLRIEDEVSDAEAAVRRLGAGPRGTLRVSAPFTLARVVLLPLLPEFLRQYPEVRVALTLKNEPEDLVGRGAEVALSPWPLPPSRHSTRLLGTMHSRLDASPAYLEKRGKPEAPHDLTNHPTLVYAGGAAPPRLSWTLAAGPRSETIPLFPSLIPTTTVRCTPRPSPAPVWCSRRASSPRTRSDPAPWSRCFPSGRVPPWRSAPCSRGRSSLFPRARAFIDLLVSRACCLLERGGDGGPGGLACHPLPEETMTPSILAALLLCGRSHGPEERSRVPHRQ